MKRRDFVAAAAAVVFVPSPKSSPYQDAEYVRVLADRLAGNRYELGGVPLAPSALDHVRKAGRVIGDSRDRRLLMAASVLADQAALVLYDAGRLTVAAHVGTTALSLSRRAVDFQGQANAYDTLSRISGYRGDHARGVAYARKGLRLPDLPAGQRAFLNMRLGRSLAAIPGQGNASRTAFDRARSTDGLSPLGEAAMIGDVGIGLGLLREYREAEALLDEAAELIGRWSPLFQAQYLGRQIQTALRASQPSHAAARMFALAGVAPLVTSSRLDKRISEILGQSAAWHNVPEMRDARAQLSSVSRQDLPTSTGQRPVRTRT